VQSQGPLDPLVAGIMHYTSNKDLQAKTHLLFQVRVGFRV